MPKIAAIVQARQNSSRLPDKVLLPLNGKPVLERVLERLGRVELLDDIVIATTSRSPQIVRWCEHKRINFHIGSEEDIISRVLETAVKFDIGSIVEITADCPLIDPCLVSQCIETFVCHPEYDYVSNCVPIRSYPDGMDVQVYSIKALVKLDELTDKKTRKHCGWNMPQFGRDIFKCLCKEAIPDFYWPDLRLTLDTIEDYELINKIYHRFGDENFGLSSILRYLRSNEELLTINNRVRTKDPSEG